jgi:hypothetical protein
MLLLCNNNAINSISGGLVTKIEVYLLATRTVVRIVLICSLFYCISRPACIELKPSQSESQSQSQSQPVLVDEANQTKPPRTGGMGCLMPLFFYTLAPKQVGDFTSHHME